MKKCSISSVSLVLGIVALVSVGSLFAQVPPQLEQDNKGVVTSLNYATPAEMMALNGWWNVTECCNWTGSWRRRPNTNIYDASWKHINGTVVTDIVRMVSWNKSSGVVTFTRDGNNGTYRAYLDASKLNLQRGTTSWYPAGLGWSATAVIIDDDKKGVVAPIRR